MTGNGDIRMAVKAIKQGAYDYVTKPVNPEEILATINSAISSTDAKTHEIHTEFLHLY
jgi:FixJ family two-component response regulator